MPKSPKKIQEIFERAVNAWKDLAPDKKFSNKALSDLLAQVEKSMAPRRRLLELANEEKQQIALREAEDAKTLKLIEQVTAGIKGDDEFGDDSALWEAFGLVRRSERKSGLTRRKQTTEEANP